MDSFKITIVDIELDSPGTTKVQLEFEMIGATTVLGGRILGLTESLVKRKVRLGPRGP